MSSLHATGPSSVVFYHQAICHCVSLRIWDYEAFWPLINCSRVMLRTWWWLPLRRRAFSKLQRVKLIKVSYYSSCSFYKRLQQNLTMHILERSYNGVDLTLRGILRILESWWKRQDVPVKVFGLNGLVCDFFHQEIGPKWFCLLQLNVFTGYSALCILRKTLLTNIFIL